MFKKTTAILQAVIFFICQVLTDTQLVSAETVTNHSPEPFKNQIEQLRLKLLPYGNIQALSLENTRKFVLLFSDLHCDYQAQKNIKNALQVANKIFKKRLSIGVEGASGPIDTRLLKNIPLQDVKQQLNEWFLKRGFISGSDYFSSYEDAYLFGLEEPELYFENLRAFQKSFGLRGKTSEKLDLFEEIIDSAAKNVFPPEYNHFRKTQKENSFSQWIAEALSLAKKRRWSLGDYPQLNLYQEISVAEPGLGTAALESEYNLLIDRVKTQASKEDLKKMILEGLLYRTGKTDQLHYLSFLKKSCRKQGIEWENFKSLSKRLKIEKTYKKIHLDSLLSEFHSLLSRFKSEWIQTSEQKSLESLFEKFETLRELSTLELTREKASNFLSKKLDFSPESLYANLKSFDIHGTMPETEIKNLFKELAQARLFYEKALGRDHALFKNTFSRLQESEGPIVIVTGGFHTGGLIEQLKSHQISYLSFIPTTDAAEGTALYNERMLNHAGAFKEMLQTRSLRLAPLNRLENKIADPKDIFDMKCSALLRMIAENPSLAVTWAKSEGVTISVNYVGQSLKFSWNDRNMRVFFNELSDQIKEPFNEWFKKLETALNISPEAKMKMIWTSFTIHEIRNALVFILVLNDFGKDLDEQFTKQWRSFKRLRGKNLPHNARGFQSYFRQRTGNLSQLLITYEKNPSDEIHVKFKEALEELKEEVQIIFDLIPKNFTQTHDNLVQFRNKKEAKNFFNDLIGILEEGHQAALSKERVRVNLGRTLWDFFSKEARRYGIKKIERKAPYDEAFAFLVPRHLRQIIRNLVKNAKEAARSDEPIALSLGLRVNKERQEAVLEFRDTGKGIAPENIGQLFQLSFSTKGSGRGIGLYLIKQMVENWGGRIEVESQLGSGTTFRIVFPLAKSAAKTGEEAGETTGVLDDLSILTTIIDSTVATAMEIQLFWKFLFTNINYAMEWLEEMDLDLSIDEAREELVLNSRKGRVSHYPFNEIKSKITVPLEKWLSHLKDKLKALEGKKTRKIWREFAVHELRNGLVSFFLLPHLGKDLDKSESGLWQTFIEMPRPSYPKEYSLSRISSFQEYFQLRNAQVLDAIEEFKSSGDSKKAKALKVLFQCLEEEILALLDLIPSKYRANDPFFKQFENLIQAKAYFSELTSIIDEANKGVLSKEKEIIDPQERISRILQAEAGRFRIPEVEISSGLSNDDKIEVLPRHLTQILRNLVKNAHEAKNGKDARAGEEDGKSSLTLKAALKKSPDGEQIILELKDNGPGMPDAIKNGLFRLSFSTKGKGRGIGLYLSKQMAENWGGKIDVESKLGEGTTFRITFPAATVSSIPARRAKKASVRELVIAKNIAEQGVSNVEIGNEVRRAISEGQAIAVDGANLGKLLTWANGTSQLSDEDLVDALTSPVDQIPERAKKKLKTAVKNDAYRLALRTSLASLFNAMALSSTNGTPILNSRRIVILLNKPNKSRMFPLADGRALAHAGFRSDKGQKKQGSIYLHIKTLQFVASDEERYVEHLAEVLKHEEGDLNEGFHRERPDVEDWAKIKELIVAKGTHYEENVENLKRLLRGSQPVEIPGATPPEIFVPKDRAPHSVPVMDALIIGAGPSGLMLSQLLKRLGLSFSVLEKGRIGESWAKIAQILQVTFRPALFSGLELYPPDWSLKGSEAVLKFLNWYVEQFHLRSQITEHEAAEKITPVTVDGENLWEIISRNESTGLAVIRYARNVITATGIFHNPRELGIRGEKDFPEKVFRVIKDSDADFLTKSHREDKEVVVIGGGNTALLTALRLRKKVKKVTIIMPEDDIRWRDQTHIPTDADPMYRDGFKEGKRKIEGLQSWIDNTKEGASKLREEGDAELVLIKGSRATGISEDKISFKLGKDNPTESSIPYGRCYICAGFRPDTDWLQRQGIGVADSRVTLDPVTLQAMNQLGVIMRSFFLLGIDPVTRGGINIEQMKSQAEVIAGQILLMLQMSRTSKEFSRRVSMPSLKDQLSSEFEAKALIETQFTKSRQRSFLKKGKVESFREIALSLIDEFNLDTTEPKMRELVLEAALSIAEKGDSAWESAKKFIDFLKKRMEIVLPNISDNQKRMLLTMTYVLSGAREDAFETWSSQILFRFRGDLSIPRLSIASLEDKIRIMTCALNILMYRDGVQELGKAIEEIVTLFHFKKDELRSIPFTKKVALIELITNTILRAEVKSLYLDKELPAYLLERYGSENLSDLPLAQRTEALEWLALQINQGLFSPMPAPVKAHRTGMDKVSEEEINGVILTETADNPANVVITYGKQRVLAGDIVFKHESDGHAQSAFAELDRLRNQASIQRVFAGNFSEIRQRFLANVAKYDQFAQPELRNDYENFRSVYHNKNPDEPEIKTIEEIDPRSFFLFFNYRMKNATVVVLKRLEFLDFEDADNHWDLHAGTRRNTVYIPGGIYEAIKERPKALAAAFSDEVLDGILGGHSDISDQIIDILGKEELENQIQGLIDFYPQVVHREGMSGYLNMIDRLHNKGLQTWLIRFLNLKGFTEAMQILERQIENAYGQLASIVLPEGNVRDRKLYERLTLEIGRLETLKENILNTLGVNRNLPPPSAKHYENRATALLRLSREMSSSEAPKEFVILTSSHNDSSDTFAVDLKASILEQNPGLKIKVLDQELLESYIRDSHPEPLTYEKDTLYMVAGGARHSEDVQEILLERVFKGREINPKAKIIGLYQPPAADLDSGELQFYDWWYYGENFSNYHQMVWDGNPSKETVSRMNVHGFPYAQSGTDTSTALSPGMIFQGKYRLVEKLGKGGIGEAWEAVLTEDMLTPDHTLLPKGTTVVVKFANTGVQSKQAYFTKLLKNEAARMKEIKKDVPRLFDAGSLFPHGYFIVMEKKGKDFLRSPAYFELSARLQAMSLEEGLTTDQAVDRLIEGAPPEQTLEGKSPKDILKAKSFFRKLLRKIETIHESGVLHRDIKKSNILVEEGSQDPVLMDFSHSKRMDSDERFMKYSGTPGSLAPETILGDDENAGTDLFQAGVLFYELFVGRNPFSNSQGRQIPEGRWRREWEKIIVQLKHHTRFGANAEVLLRTLTENPFAEIDAFMKDGDTFAPMIEFIKKMMYNGIADHHENPDNHKHPSGSVKSKLSRGHRILRRFVSAKEALKQLDEVYVPFTLDGKNYRLYEYIGEDPLGQSEIYMARNARGDKIRLSIPKPAHQPSENLKPYQLEIAKDYKDMSIEAAQQIQSLVAVKKNAVLLLPTGNTPKGMYQELVRMAHAGEIDFRNTTIFMLDEYRNGRDYHDFIHENLISRLPEGNRPKAVNVLNGKAKNPSAEVKRYEKLIQEAGGVDMAVLGIGVEGHIGFNETGSSPESKTRLIDLAPSTIEANPEAKAKGYTQALTVGISNILAARKVILLANGPKKAPIIQRFWAEAPTPDIPASWLKTHNHVSILIDSEAASNLPEALQLSKLTSPMISAVLEKTEIQPLDHLGSFKVVLELLKDTSENQNWKWLVEQAFLDIAKEGTIPELVANLKNVSDATQLVSKINSPVVFKRMLAAYILQEYMKTGTRDGIFQKPWFQGLDQGIRNDLILFEKKVRDETLSAIKWSPWMKADPEFGNQIKDWMEWIDSVAQPNFEGEYGFIEAFEKGRELLKQNKEPYQQHRLAGILNLIYLDQPLRHSFLGQVFRANISEDEVKALATAFTLLHPFWNQFRNMTRSTALLFGITPRAEPDMPEYQSSRWTDQAA